ncbi:MAG: acetolactate synthase [Planctomycetota bacterium]
MVSTSTQRGYKDHLIRQTAIFLNNKVGELSDVLRHLQSRQINVRAVSVADSVDFAVVRMIVDKVDLARETLTEAGYAISESEIIAVELPDQGAGLLQTCRTLLSAEINIHYAYPMFARRQGSAIVILHVDEPDFAGEALTKRGYRIINEGDLQEDDTNPGVW